MGDVTTALLDRRLYTISDVASLLGMPSSTLSYWMHGLTRRGHEYPPALRHERNDDPHVTWGEFIEASLLRQLRDRGVRLDGIRTFSRAVRLALGWNYPLARHDLYVGPDGRLVYEAQQIADLPPEARLLVASETYGSGQLLLQRGQALEAFLERVNFQDEIPVGYWPDPTAKVVVCDPQRRFGSPQVSGVPTEALWELHSAGEQIEGIAGNFELHVREVEAAIRFERDRRSTVKVA